MSLIRIGLSLATLLVSLFILPAVGRAQPPDLPSLDELLGDKPKDELPPGDLWVLIISGHPGDAEHREMYAATVETLQAALVERLDVSPERIRVQFGEMAEEVAPPEDVETLAVSNVRGGATREEIAAEVADLRKQLQPDDALWTIVIGHAHWNGRNCFLNVPGPDLHQEEFAALFADWQLRQQVFFLTTSVSGFFVQPLSGEGRIVISATEADLETNETLFHAALAEVLSSPPEEDELDADGDGRITLLDLYVAVTRNVAQRYVADDLLATEHAQLEDNGDGRGTELQVDYLTEEQGGRATEDSRPPRIRPNSDGAQALQTLLRLK